MSLCLLCPSPAVADGLCVEDGARPWAADLWMLNPRLARTDVGRLDAGHYNESVASSPRGRALWELCTPDAARAFLDKLDAARKARDEQVCGRGCKSHEEDR